MKRRALLGTVGAAWLGSMYVYGGRGSEDSEQPADTADTSGDGSISAETETPPPSAAGFDPGVIEQRFIERFNAMREEHNRATVSRGEILSEMGQEHAANMAQNGYIGHTQPSGQTIADRYRERGLLPRCELPADDGSDRYYPGAENVAGAAVGRVTHPGTEETFFIAENDDVARFLVDSWMSSEGHRDVMLLTAVRRIGLGTVVRNDGEIFAALEFC